MAISFGFFNSDPGVDDRDYDANDFNNIMRGEFANGRMAGYGDPSEQFLVASTSSPYEISITPGAYLFNGMWFKSTENEVIAIDAPGSLLALVIRLSVANRKLAFTVVEQSATDPNTDATLAYFSKAGDGAIVVTQQFMDVSIPAGIAGAVIFPYVIDAVNWAGKQYVISSDAIKAHTVSLETIFELSLLEADFGCVTAATEAQMTAWIKMGDMSEVSCVDGAYTFEIDGDVPTVDIPVLVEISRVTRVSG